MTVACYPAYDSSQGASRWRLAMHDLLTDAGGARLFKMACEEFYTLATKPNPGLSNFWVSLWVKHTTVGSEFQYYFFTGGYATSYSGFALGSQNGTPGGFFNHATGGSTRIQLEFTDKPLTAGTLYHLVYLFNRTAGTVTLYVNGVASAVVVDISSKTAACSPCVAASCIGAAGADYYHTDGSLSNIMYGAGTLPTAAEIAELYQGGYGKVYDTLSAALKAKVVYAWNMDETSGTMASSATANNATFTPSNVLANPYFTTNMSSWTLIQGGTSTAARNTAEHHEGASCCELAIDGASTPAGISQTKAIAGREYTVTFYAKASAGTPTMSLSDAGGELQEFTLSTSWAQYTKTFTADDTTIKFVSKACTSASIYLDEVSAVVTADSGTVYGPQSIPTNATHVDVAGTDVKWRTESINSGINQPGPYTLKTVDAVLAGTLPADCDAIYFGILQGTTSAVTWMTLPNGLTYADMSASLRPRDAAYTFHYAFPDDFTVTLEAGVTYWFAVSVRSVTGHTTGKPQIGVMQNGQGPSGGFWRHAAQATLDAAALSYQAVGGGEEQIRIGVEFTTPVRKLFSHSGGSFVVQPLILPARMDGDYWLKISVIVDSPNALTCVLNDESAGSAAARDTLILDMGATDRITFGGQVIGLAADGAEASDVFDIGINVRPTTKKIDCFYQNLTTGQGPVGAAADFATFSHAVRKTGTRGTEYSITGNPQWLTLSGTANTYLIEDGWEPVVLLGDSQTTTFNTALPAAFTYPRILWKAGIGGGSLVVDTAGQSTAGYLRYKSTTPGNGDLCEMTGMVFVFCGYGVNDVAGYADLVTQRNGLVMNWAQRAAEIIDDLQDNGNHCLIIGLPPYSAVAANAQNAACIKHQFNPMLEGLALGARCAYVNPWHAMCLSGTSEADIPTFNPLYTTDGLHYKDVDAVALTASMAARAYELSIVGGWWSSPWRRLSRSNGSLWPI
jgi:hypothetical protein